MWEYPSYACSDVSTLMTFDLYSDIPRNAKLRESGEIVLKQNSAPCHGVVLWMDYMLTDALTVSTGLLKVYLFVLGIIISLLDTLIFQTLSQLFRSLSSP